MTTPQLCVLLYSKYSPKSKELMDLLEKAPVDLTSSIGLQAVCIDNDQIRKKIQTATSVGVSAVPTILIVHNTGAVEKYEAEHAFMWAEQTVNQLLPPEPPTPPPVQPDPEPVVQPEPDIDYKSSVEPLSEPEPLGKDGEGSEVEDTVGMPKPPPVGIRNGAGNYDIETKFGEVQERRQPAAKSDQQSKPRDLMAMAQAMQKEREQSGTSANKRQ